MRHAASVFLDGRVAAALVVVAGLAAVVARPLAHRLRSTVPHAWLLLAVSGSVLAFTLLNRRGHQSPSLSALRYWTDGWGHLGHAVAHDPAWWLNVILFVPPALLWTNATRRPGAVLLAGALASAVIESMQGVTGLGALDPVDWVANTIGAALATLAGFVWLRTRGQRSSWSGRSVAVGTAGALACVAVAVIVVNIEADRRGDRLLQEVRAVFATTNSSDLAPLLSDESRAGFARFQAMGPVRPDSIEYVDGTTRFSVRYSVEFFGADRCVLADFSPQGSSFRQATGSACTDFRG
jgi:hypothetical protein